MSKDVKSEQLGMSFSKASGILRKSLLFTFAQKCNMDTCYQCGNKITSIDDFTIEHKVPWLYSKDPANLFFDIDNIAFSHSSCNYSASRVSNPITKHGFIGVRCPKDKKNRTKPWRTRITIDGKSKDIGRFATAKEAAIAYDEAIIELKGPKARTNKSLGLL